MKPPSELATGVRAIRPPAPLALCAESDVPYGEGRSVETEYGRIGVFNTAVGFLAIDNDCPHEGGPLSDGIVADACVTCPLHGWRIDLEDGSVHGRDDVVRTHQLIVQDGTVWLLPAHQPERES